LYSNTTATDNVAIGALAMYTNTTGANNVAMGSAALRQTTTASGNTAVGQVAGYSDTTGYNNVFVGYQAGYYLTTGADCIFIGHAAAASVAGALNEIVIGANATGKGTSTALISPNASYVFQGNNTTLWAITSDQRIKKNIVDNNTGLSVISQIQVRNFEYRLPEEVTELPQNQAIQKTGLQLGVIAQELKEILPDCVKEEGTGVLSVNSDSIMWHMINAIKELSTQVTELKAEVATLKGA
jgi:hypothetical protein